MFRAYLTSALLITTILFSNCIKSNGELEGSVFIVTQGKENIKLALVKITAIPESEINQFIERKKTFIKDEYEKLEKEMKLIKVEIEKFHKEYDKAKINLDGIDSQRKILKSKEQNLRAEFSPYLLDENLYLSEFETQEEKIGRAKQKVIQKQLESIKKQIAGIEIKVAQANKILSIAEEKLEASKSKLSKLTENFVSYLKKDYLLDRLPEGEIKTVTDSEGKFSLNLPAGRYALTASSERRVYNITEKYNWFVWVDIKSSEPNEIMLSNQNTLGEDSEDSIFKYSELFPLLNNSSDNSTIPLSEV